MTTNSAGARFNELQRFNELHRINELQRINLQLAEATAFLRKEARLDRKEDRVPSDVVIDRIKMQLGQRWIIVKQHGKVSQSSNQ